jgi:hypothetical protein
MEIPSAQADAVDVIDDIPFDDEEGANIIAKRALVPDHSLANISNLRPKKDKHAISPNAGISRRIQLTQTTVSVIFEGDTRT